MAEEVSLRTARNGDGDQLLHLLKKVAKTSNAVVIPHLDSLTAKEEDHQLSLIENEDNCLMLVAELGSKIIGLVAIMPPSDKLQDTATHRMLKNEIIKEPDALVGELGIVVDPGYQGQGLGTNLVNEAQYWLKNYSDLDAIVLTVFNDNQPARALYQAAHFIDVGQVMEDGRPARMMVWLPQ